MSQLHSDRELALKLHKAERELNPRTRKEKENSKASALIEKSPNIPWKKHKKQKICKKAPCADHGAGNVLPSTAALDQPNKDAPSLDLLVKDNVSTYNF